MEQATQGTGVQVTQTADNQLKLEVPSDISFDVGRANIKPALIRFGAEVEAILRRRPQGGLGERIRRERSWRA